MKMKKTSDGKTNLAATVEETPRSRSASLGDGKTNLAPTGPDLEFSLTVGAKFVFPSEVFFIFICEPDDTDSSELVSRREAVPG